MRRTADPSARLRPALRVSLCVLPLLAAVAVGQQDDVPLPPRLDDAPVNRPARAQTPSVPLVPSVVSPSGRVSPSAQPSPAASSAAAPLTRAPDRARLAPLPEERAGETEEIVVIGGANGWRLPDLGSAWREEEAAAQPGQVQATLLPLYDPENPTTRPDLFLLNREVSRIGYIDLFRVRFGRRTLPE